jgi:hypothetical protein
MAVRGIIELFRLVKRKKELYREILAFLISHNHRIIRIYGYYLIIKENETIFYYYLIYIFDFIVLNNKEK